MRINVILLTVQLKYIYENCLLLSIALQGPGHNLNSPSVTIGNAKYALTIYIMTECIYLCLSVTKK